jgi:ABC-type dipeptide/oligopeptide/nickel transport system permease subunit
MSNLVANQFDTVLATVCPVAPPGAQAYADQMTGYVMWGVLILLGIGVIVGLGAIVGGRVFSLPHASKAGIVSLVMMFIAGIAYMVVPPMVAGITGSGCV